MYNDSNTLAVGVVNPRPAHFFGGSVSLTACHRPRSLRSAVRDRPTPSSELPVTRESPRPANLSQAASVILVKNNPPGSFPMPGSLLASELRPDMIRDSRAVVGSRFGIPPEGSRRGRSGYPAGVAQWQSTGFVNRGLWVQLPPLALIVRRSAGVGTESRTLPGQVSGRTGRYSDIAKTAGPFGDRGDCNGRPRRSGNGGEA